MNGMQMRNASLWTFLKKKVKIEIVPTSPRTTTSLSIPSIYPLYLCCIAAREAHTATVFATVLTDNCTPQPKRGAKDHDLTWCCFEGSHVLLFHVFWLIEYFTIIYCHLSDDWRLKNRDKGYTELCSNPFFQASSGWAQTYLFCSQHFSCD